MTLDMPDTLRQQSDPQHGNYKCGNDNRHNDRCWMRQPRYWIRKNKITGPRYWVWMNKMTSLVSKQDFLISLALSISFMSIYSWFLHSDPEKQIVHTNHIRMYVRRERECMVRSLQFVQALIQLGNYMKVCIIMQSETKHTS